MFFAVFSTKFAKKAQFCTIFAKKTANFLHVSEIISIFAPSNSMSGTNRAPQQAALFCVILQRKSRAQALTAERTAPRGVWDNHSEAFAYRSLTARSVVFFYLSNSIRVMKHVVLSMNVNGEPFRRQMSLAAALRRVVKASLRVQVSNVTISRRAAV